MRNSIYRKIRSRMMHTLIIAVVGLMIIMAAGLLIVRSNLISIINLHSDSVAQEAIDATDQTMLILALIELAVVLLAIFMIVYFSTRLAKDITRPILKLTEEAALIGSGK
ncbi:MAG: hypothetical protein FWC17_05370, partial [Treponema sp.]|nr:hypothetical protein [Treponema sp.]